MEFSFSSTALSKQKQAHLHWSLYEIILGYLFLKSNASQPRIPIERTPQKKARVSWRASSELSDESWLEKVEQVVDVVDVVVVLVEATAGGVIVEVAVAVRWVVVVVEEVRDEEVVFVRWVVDGVVEVAAIEEALSDAVEFAEELSSDDADTLWSTFSITSWIQGI